MLSASHLSKTRYHTGDQHGMRRLIAAYHSIEKNKSWKTTQKHLPGNASAGAFALFYRRMAFFVFIIKWLISSRLRSEREVQDFCIKSIHVKGQYPESPILRTFPRIDIMTITCYRIPGHFIHVLSLVIFLWKMTTSST